MDIDLNVAPGEGEGEHGAPLDEDHHAGNYFDLNQNPDELEAGHHIDLNMNLGLHEQELPAGHHIDLNMNPGAALDDEYVDGVFFPIEDELESLRESDESDDGLEDQVGAFHTMEEELQAMNDALEDLQVDQDDEGVYAGDVEVEFEEEELDDSEPDEAMDNDMDVEQEQEQTDNDMDVEQEQEQTDNDMDVEQEQGDNEENKYKNLTDMQRVGIYEELLARSVNRRLKKNTTRLVANMFHVSVFKVRRVWRRVKQCRRDRIPVDVRSRKPKNCGRKRVVVNLNIVPTILLNQRGTIRGLARALGVSKSTLHRVFTEGLLRRHSNTLKPYLKEANKKARLRFCISMFDQQSLDENRATFKDMRNIIHLDEKWFNATMKARKFYMLPSEEDPNRTVQNKNSIGKIMFLCLISRPRYNAEGACIF